jgi:transcriptional regulator with XRE-family HTH domain
VKSVSTIRSLLGIPQNTLAERLGMSQASVSGYERGEILMSPVVAIRLVHLAADMGLTISLDQIYELKPLPTAAKQPESATAG